MKRDTPVNRLPRSPGRSRCGAASVWIGAATVSVLGVLALALDVGRIALWRSRLQVAADSAALAAARGEAPTGDLEVEPGTWDSQARTFTPAGASGNAVRATARRSEDSADRGRLCFEAVFGHLEFTSQATAVAAAEPRDIVFMVDLSGSMNDDTEPCWATGALDLAFGPNGRSGAGTRMAEQLFEDFGFGGYPGESEWVGEPWGVGRDEYAYAELSRDGGPLSGGSVPAEYRVLPGDSELQRKQKAYTAIIDLQIARIMPRARPDPGRPANFAYWTKYLDYVIEPVRVRASKKSRPEKGDESNLCEAPEGPLRGKLDSSPFSGRPPFNRGWLPPDQDRARIDGFNNPNADWLPEVAESVPRSFRNQIGYRTYVQFMLDHGRNLGPVAGVYVPLSQHSPDCPWHEEATAAGAVRFPPREQPVHAVRRALIAGLESLKRRNRAIRDPAQRDWVAIVRFDGQCGGGPVVEQALTADYDAATAASARLQACGDRAATRGTEAALVAARNHLRSADRGGNGRWIADKVVVLVTGGMPDLFVSSHSDIAQSMRDNPSGDYYATGEDWLNAPLAHAAEMRSQRWRVFALGIGSGADHGFLDRLARLGGTADDSGHSPRAGGNPAEYEEQLTEALEAIVNSPRVRLVQ